jgi:hypothetical protein
MKKWIIYSILLSIISCNSVHTKNERTEIDKEAVNKFIQAYIKEKSKTKQYTDLQKTFYCYYKNAVLSNRRAYINIDTALGEKFYGLDSLVIFNANMDSAIVFFVRKLANDNRDQFQYYAQKLFAYKNLKGWRFYDGCGSAVYDEKNYTYSTVSNNERIWFAIDGEWLLNLDNKGTKESPNFIQHACDMWCGPCADSRDSLNIGIHDEDIKENTPPEILYECK